MRIFFPLPLSLTSPFSITAVGLSCSGGRVEVGGWVGGGCGKEEEEEEVGGVDNSQWRGDTSLAAAASQSAGRLEVFTARRFFPAERILNTCRRSPLLFNCFVYSCFPQIGFCWGGYYCLLLFFSFLFLKIILYTPHSCVKFAFAAAKTAKTPDSRSRGATLQTRKAIKKKKCV